MAVASREVHLIERPEGLPVATQFEIVETTIDDPAEDARAFQESLTMLRPHVRLWSQIKGIFGAR